MGDLKWQFSAAFFQKSTKSIPSPKKLFNARLFFHLYITIGNKQNKQVKPSESNQSLRNQ